MAVCGDCEQEMTEARTCTMDGIVLDRQRYARQRVRRPIGPAGRCGDCGVTTGGYHHLGCDLERCPRCRGQFLSCGCAWADDEHERLIGVAGDVVVYPPSLRGFHLPPDGSVPDLWSGADPS
jgi:hypothetical protein